MAPSLLSLEGARKTSDVWESGYDGGGLCRILTLGTPIVIQGSHGILPKLVFPWRSNKSVGRTYYKFRLGHYLHNMSVAGEGRCWNYPLLGCKLIVYQIPVKSVMKANVHFKQITPKAALWHYGNSHVLISEWKKSHNRNSLDLTFRDVTVTVFFSRCIIRFGQDEGGNVCNVCNVWTWRCGIDHVFRSSSSLERRSVTSGYHGSKISGSQHSFLTETAICIVAPWKKSIGYCFLTWVQSWIENSNMSIFRFFRHICRTKVCWDSEILLPWQSDVTTSPLHYHGH